MEKLYGKLVHVDILIEDGEKTMQNIDGWAVSESEKQQHRDEHEHWLGKLHERRLTILFDIKSITEHEIRKYSNAKVVQSA